MEVVCKNCSKKFEVNEDVLDCLDYFNLVETEEGLMGMSHFSNNCLTLNRVRRTFERGRE
jgi:hypothetical protein